MKYIIVAVFFLLLSVIAGCELSSNGDAPGTEFTVVVPADSVFETMRIDPVPSAYQVISYTTEGTQFSMIDDAGVVQLRWQLRYDSTTSWHTPIPLRERGAVFADLQEGSVPHLMRFNGIGQRIWNTTVPELKGCMVDRAAELWNGNILIVAVLINPNGTSGPYRYAVIDGASGGLLMLRNAGEDRIAYPEPQPNGEILGFHFADSPVDPSLWRISSITMDASLIVQKKTPLCDVPGYESVKGIHVGDSMVVLAGTQDDGSLSVRAYGADGSLRWICPVGIPAPVDHSWYQIMVTCDGRTVYGGTYDYGRRGSDLFAVDLATGALRERRSFNSFFFSVTSRPIGGAIAVGIAKGFLGPLKIVTMPSYADR